MYTAVFITFLCVASGFEILKRCPARKRGLSCYKACRADDCMILSKAERAVLRFGDPVSVLQNKTICLEKMLQDARQRQCYKRADFNKAVNKLTSLYLKHYTSLDFADNFLITLDGRNGSFVKLDTTVPTNRFTVCVKYSPETSSLTQLASYSAGQTRVWSLSVSEDSAVFRMQGGQSVFTLPALPTTSNSSSSSQSATLCLAYKSNPAIQAHIWFRYTKSGMYTKIQPSQTIPATDNAVYSKGVLTVGGEEDSAVQFTGNVSRLSLTADHAQSVDSALPFLQCYNDPHTMLRTKLGLASPSVQWSDVKTMGQYSGGAVVHNMTADERREVCGLSCSQCSVQCAGVSSCKGLAECASCEQHALCLGDSNIPLQKKYKECEEGAKPVKRKRKCTVETIEQCIIAGTTGSRCSVLKCLDTLAKCSDRTLARLKQSNDLHVNRLRLCPRFGLIKRKLSLKVPKTASSCIESCNKQFPDYPFLRPTDESCQRFQSFRECIDSCKICQTTGCTNQDRAFNVPFILNNYKNFGCSLPPVCKKLFKTESARLIEQYNIDVEASMGPKFDYVFFHHDPDLTPKKLAQMCPDKN